MKGFINFFTTGGPELAGHAVEMTGLAGTLSAMERSVQLCYLQLFHHRRQQQQPAAKTVSE
jgi:hypothetical protein